MLLAAVWLQWWTQANEDHPNEDIGYWLGVYVALGMVTLLGCAFADLYVATILLVCDILTNLQRLQIGRGSQNLQEISRCPSRYDHVVRISISALKRYLG